MRSPLPRTILIRLETGRLVLYSLLAGGLVGLLGSGWRYVLAGALDLGAAVLGYRSPGTAGEEGLLIAFGDLTPYALLILPLLGALYAFLMPAGRRSEPLNAVIAGYHARGEWEGLAGQARALAANLLGNASGLLVGRDSTFTALGGVSSLLLSRLARLAAAERRILTLACVAAALGLALHAPLAAAVLMAEVLYRRFEFEFEVLMPCVLAAVCASAVSGLISGFDPLFALSGSLTPTAAQLPLYLLLAAAVTLFSWILTRVADTLTGLYTGLLGRLTGWRPLALRLGLGAAFGLVTAVIVLYSTPAVLGGGSGWLQLAVSGFMGGEAGGMAAWRWLLMALGVQLAFGGGVLVSASVGGLMGVGLASLLGSLGLNLDFPVAALIGAATCLTVTLNIPVAAALLAVTWGGDALLPAALASTALAHTLSGEASLLSAQLSRRSDSRAHAQLVGQVGSTTVLGRAASPLRLLPVRSVPAQPLAVQVPVQSPPAPPLFPDVPALQGPSPSTGAEPAAEFQSGVRRLYRQDVPGSWLGARLNLLTLPAGMELLSVVRGGQVRLASPELRLITGDELLLLCTPAEFQNWQQSLRVVGQA
ncbi:chloride channel protein [Deinococcus radiomollis]|uniref:chloride channel protein n=1 Tax=Deinococcus radiomollis TaxID=468916 RepID=UPI003891820F